METQLVLDLPHREDFSAARFIAGDSNAEARAALARWRDWPKGALALVGPPGTGKSHLGAMWREETGAAAPGRARLPAFLDAAPSGRPVLVEDADQGVDEMALFHLLNRAATGACPAVLLTAQTAPGRWPVATPDLASRLKALAVAELREPDDAMLRRLLEKLFRDRQAPVTDGLIDYLLPRMERSVAAARRLVEALDRSALARRTPVTRAVARSVLDGWREDGEGGDS